MPIIPIKHRSTPQTITNVDFIDQVSGVGYITFYAGDDNAGYVLVTNPFYGQNGTTQSGTNTAIDIDFDIPVEKTLIVDGTCIVTIPFGWSNAGAGWEIAAKDTSATLRHWDGTTETDLGTASYTTNFTGGTANAMVDWIIALKFDVTRKVFKRGDTLRLNIGIAAGGGANKSILAHDPVGRTVTDSNQRTGPWLGLNNSGSWDLTTLTVQVPIVVDL